MRLATAFDEIEPLGDPRVRDNEAYLGLLLLSRVVVRLGDFSPVPPEVIAGLYTADFAYLQGLYLELNTALSLSPAAAPLSPPTVPAAPPAATPSGGTVETTCPHCGTDLLLDLSGA
ncbi:Secreted protein [Deinococcus gobiensis I-0]|uniref:Secreted protein n=2 Tax=Deinococcus TaxID=1298 RepID=H8GWQ7_DEIGI|nr:Secreted protein [Deinococcus gobiensis I-0]